jgi:6-phosphofructo-2-kinase/fructose-2,6-biphosphatase 2
MSREEAERDFRKRIEQYESVYQTITEPHLSYCKILNVGKQVEMNRINGYLQSRIAFYLMNLHLKPRSIYLSRVRCAIATRGGEYVLTSKQTFHTQHGESMYNVGGMIGGDSPLSPRGERYAAALPALILDNIGDAPLTVCRDLKSSQQVISCSTVCCRRFGRQLYSARKPPLASCHTQRRHGSLLMSWMLAFATA